MATYYIDPVNGIDSQSGGAPVTKTNCTITSGSSTLVVPNNTGLVSGMRVFVTDMENSGGLITLGTTISSISSNNITLSANAIGSSSTATVIFSPARKTLSSISGVAAPGDFIRLKQSKSPVNTGLTATFTNTSTNVSVTGLPIQSIDLCETAFTSSNGATNNVITSYAVQGTNACQIITPAGSATNGVMGYKTISGGLNLTGYTRISFYAYAISVANAGSFTINLCSDNVGATPVYSGTIPFAASVSSITYCGLYPVVIDIGSNMTTTINSISIQRTGATGTPGSNQLIIDNIVACKPASDVSAITHKSLVSIAASGKEWYSVRSLTNNNIDLYIDTTYGYSGSTYTGALYAKEPLLIPSAYSSIFSASGTESNRITISGGWNNTDMSTQVDETLYSDNRNQAGNAILQTTGSFLTVERLGFVQVAPNSSGDCYVSNTGNQNIFNRFSVIVGRNFTLRCANDKNSGTQILNSTFVAPQMSLSSPRSQIIPDLYALFTTFSNYNSIDIKDCKVVNAYYCFYSLSTAIEQNFNVRRSSFHGRNLFSANITTNNSQFYDCDFDLASLQAASVSPKGILFKNCNFVSDPTESEVGGVDASLTLLDGQTRLHAVNQNPNDHRVYKGSGVILSHSGAYRHTASGISWGLKPGNASYVNANNPHVMSLAKVYVTAGVSFSASCWVYKTGSDLNAGLRVKEEDVLGLSQQLQLSTAAPNTWQQVTLTFTPTASGVIEIEAITYGILSLGYTSNFAYFDDFSTA